MKTFFFSSSAQVFFLPDERRPKWSWRCWPVAKIWILWTIGLTGTVGITYKFGATRRLRNFEPRPCLTFRLRQPPTLNTSWTLDLGLMPKYVKSWSTAKDLVANYTSGIDKKSPSMVCFWRFVLSFSTNNLNRAFICRSPWIINTYFKGLLNFCAVRHF